MTTWREEKRPVQSVQRLTVPELYERSRVDDRLQIVDVRERAEWDEGHIAGSVHVPYHDIDSIPEELDPTEPMAAICSSGQRSAVAASLLQRHGASDVLHVVEGGVGTWRDHGWPTDS